MLPTRAQGVNSSHLMINNLRVDDAGKYRCIQSNLTGRIASDYGILTVKGDYTACIIIVYTRIIKINGE